MNRPEGTVIRELWPLLDVSDIGRSLRFYRDQLGFELVGHDGSHDHPMGWCRLARGGASIMLQQAAPQGHDAPRRGKGVGFYFVCDDADAMHAELLGRGLSLQPPRVAYYGMKQLIVPEPDGYAICFESPTPDWPG